MKLFKNPFFYTTVFSLSLLGLIIGSYVFGWTTPTASPPAGNVVLSPGALPSGSAGYVQFASSSTAFGGDAALFWDNTNKRLGIGTTSPGAKLEVEGNIAASGSQFIIDRPDTTGGWARGIMYYPTGNFSGTELAGIGLLGSGTGVTRMYLTHGDNPWDSITGMHILTNGNVGIGTTNPEAKLEISGGAWSSDLLHLYPYKGGSAGYYMKISSVLESSNNIDYRFIVHDSAGGVDRDVLYFDSSTGNVGIGTTGPNVKLEVKGNTAIATQGYIPSDGAGASTLEVIGSGSGADSSILSLAHYWGGRKYPFNIRVTGVSNFTAGLAFDTSTYSSGVVTTERMRLGSNGGLSLGSTYVPQTLVQGQ